MLAASAAVAALVLSGCGAKEQASTDQGGGQNSNQGSEGFSSLKLLAEAVSSKSATKQSAHMSMTAAAAGQSIKAQGDMRLGTSPAMDMTMAIPQLGDAQMVLVDDVFYIKLPTELTPGKPWLKIDTTGNDQLSQVFGAIVKQVKENGDPSQTLKQLEEAGEITGKKSEDLNGKPTTHYSVTVDIKKAAEKLTPELKAAMESVLQKGVTTYPMEIWLDKDNLPVRVSVETPIVNPATQQPDLSKVVIDYSDWGKTVNVTAPPADQVGTFPS